MSNARYIEIDSTYRNRKDWPNPAEFEILISQSGRKDRLQAQDPVSTAAPLTSSWVCNKFNIGSGSGSSITADVNSSTGIGAAGDNKSTLILTSTALNQFQQIENYYVGAVATNTTNNSSSRIITYKWLYTNTAQITLEGSISILPPPAINTIRINDPSDITDLENSYVFVPNGRLGFNAYPNYILWNETQQNYSPILSYDTSTKLVKVKIDGLSPTWTLNDTFSIRKEAPLFGELNNELGYTDSKIFSLPSAYSLSDYDAYRNSYIKVGNEIGLITRYVTLTGNALGGDDTHIILPDNASNINGFYKNMYIQINNEVKKIISYTVTGIGPNIVRTAEFATFIGGPNYYVLAGDPFTLRNGFVDNAFTTPFTNGAKYEILPFSYDNHNPFVYTGSITSQQEISCYQIELMDLILPNKILNCGFGSRIAFYPYLYVEVTNISGSSSGMKNSIYSNNPNATSAVFRVPIYDVQNPIASAFVKLDGDGMTQTLKFKPNDNIFFSVRLPNGQLFKTIEQERYSPQQPNPDIQISALFSFKKL
jgi:hypothetical protein